VEYSVGFMQENEEGERERERERGKKRGERGKRGRKREREREKCPVWGFNWQKRGSAVMVRKSGGKRVERGER